MLSVQIRGTSACFPYMPSEARIELRVDPELKQRWKLEAIQEGISLTEFIVSRVERGETTSVIPATSNDTPSGSSARDSLANDTAQATTNVAVDDDTPPDAEWLTDRGEIRYEHGVLSVREPGETIWRDKAPEPQHAEPEQQS
jgi:HicB family